MDITALKKTAELAEEGVWITYEDASFKICSTDSRRYRAAVARVSKTRSSARLRKDPEAAHDMTVEAMAEGLLIDWKNVKSDGVDLPCNAENRLLVCQVEPIRNFLATEAQDIANFQREATAEDASDIKSGD